MTQESLWEAVCLGTVWGFLKEEHFLEGHRLSKKNTGFGVYLR